MCPQLSWIEQRPSKPWVGGSNPFGHIYLFHSVALLLFHMDVSLIWWVWRSWLARQIVALEAEGSSPSIHPFLYRILSDAFGLSPSGKAQDFDSCIRWFESSQPSQKLNLYGPLAQAVEHLTFNQVVRGSSPRWLIKISDIVLYLIFLYLLFCSLYIEETLRIWRNWQTRQIQVLVSTDVQVQLLLSASKKAIIIDCLFLLSDILLLIIENYTGHLQITFSCISIIVIQLITTSRIPQ